MSGRRHGGPAKREEPPINVIFKLMTERQPCSVWLTENLEIRIDGIIAGFDEFMNVTVRNAVQVKLKPSPDENPRTPMGMVVIRGDNICLVDSPDATL